MATIFLALTLENDFNNQIVEIFNQINDKKGIAENLELIGDMNLKRYEYENSVERIKSF